MPYLVRGASRLYYEEYGAGPALVLAHGVGGNHASWFNQVPVLSRSFRTVVFDHRAFGNSEDVELTGRAAYLDDLLFLLDALQIDRAILVGQSMGGGTCAAFTAWRPERVAALVVACSLAGAQLPRVLKAEMETVNAATTDLSQSERVLGPNIRRDDPAQSLLYLQIASFNSVTVRTVRGAAPTWTPQALAATRVPLLYLAAEDDVLFPPALVRGVHEVTSGSSYVEVPGVGHSAYFEEPEVFNRLLLDFLEQQGLAPAAQLGAVQP